MPDAPRPPFWPTVRRGFKRCCPHCGAPGLFQSYLRLRRACPKCGWITEREPGAVTGPMYLIAVVTQLFAVAMAFLLWLITDWPLSTMLWVALPVIALFSLIMLPFCKGAWVAVEYLTDHYSGEAGSPDYARKAWERPTDPTASEPGNGDPI